MYIDDLPFPEEIKEALRRNAAQQNMSQESFWHDVQRMLAELPQEHLELLHHIFAHLIIVVNSRYATYLDGITSTTLYHRFNICPGCKVDHDKEMQEHIHGLTPQAQLDEWIANCEKYSVEPVSEGASSVKEYTSQKVKCKNCGMEYVNLADRMIKEPGVAGCPGCIDKAKWG